MYIHLHTLLTLSLHVSRMNSAFKLGKDDEEDELRKIEKAKMDKPRALEILHVDPDDFQNHIETDRKKEVHKTLSPCYLIPSS